ncbi:MAG TPA: MtrB/PioB family outer membrane beta-barrel protein [Candidatus Acidoferrales bacterium]|nr:MtrB/PioB family outer membrane beta-barrel protein [Candidatus Acidoferrales bacterium]
MKLFRQPTIGMLLALLFTPALLCGQEQPAAKEKPEAKKETAVKEEVPQHGSIEFGVRHVFAGEVYGRPDLPFAPDVLTSKFNEYGDRRNGFVVRRLDLGYDNILGTENYVRLQSQNSVYKNQTYLASFGQYGKFKVQFRYDEIPHIYTNTARSLYVQTSPGVFTILPATKQLLQDRSSIVCGGAAQCTSGLINNNLPGFIATQIVPGENFITPAIERKAGTGLLSWNITSHWITTFLFSREHQGGTRPLGMIFNPSPSASASSLPTGVFNQQSPGTGAEVPEPINYFNNIIKVLTEYGKKDWGVQAGYTGSFFQNNTNALVFDNPFATADVPVLTFAPGASGCPAGAARCNIGAVPSRGQTGLWPDNQAHYVNAAAAFNVGKHMRVMGTVNPGWLRQNEAFLPYSANSQIFFPDSTGALTIPATSVSVLPAASLNGQKQTLAMNYTAVYTPLKDVEVNLFYRQYDYNNNTATFNLTPILGDTIGANAASTAQLTPGDPAATSGSGSLQSTLGRSNPGFNKKNLGFTGDWFFTKKSSVKAGYEGEWFDRSHRDAAHTLENSFFGALDLVPQKDLLIRFGGRHQDRKPDEYVDEAAGGVACDPASLLAARTAGIFPGDHPCGRRFDEDARVLDRLDTLVEYSMDKLTVSGGFQTIQQDFNRAGVGSNSPTALNFLTGAAATTTPYFLYGAMNDLAYTYTADASYTFSPAVSLFAEYAHERYHKRMVSRNRSPFAAAAPFCSAGGCDSANNDWESAYRDIFDTYSGGADLFLRKKAYLTAYYSLAAGRGHIFSRFLGDPTRLTVGDPDRFVLVGSSAAVSYPESVTRTHEVTAVFKYKLSERFMPKVEYRYQQFDNRDYQTSAMTQYMGCISPAGAGPGPVTGCTARQLIGTTSPNPTFTPSPFYPGFVVGDTSAARYLFLGVDQPSFRVHVLTITLEYLF